MRTASLFKVLFRHFQPILQSKVFPLRHPGFQPEGEFARAGTRDRAENADAGGYMTSGHMPLLQKPTRTVGNAFRDHIPNSYRWITENKGTAPDGLAVICAWDEIGEGGYMIPTEGEGLAMLEGMRETVGVINGNK